MTPALAAVLAYLVLQFAIGAYVARRVRTEADYLVAGRRLGLGVATFSIFATWFGAETIVASGGIAYADGVSLASAEPFGYGLCLIVLGLVFAAPLRRRGLTTLADLFRERYSAGVERVAAIVMIPSSVLWAAAQMRAFAQVVEVTGAGIDPEAAMLLAAAATILYTAVGGLMSDAINDLVQGAVLIVGLGALLVAVVMALGGPGEAAAAIAAGGRIRAVPPADTAWLDVLESWAIPVCGSVVATEVVSRVIAARTPSVARGSALSAGALYLMVGCIPVVVGLAGASLVPTVADAEQLVPTVARALLPTALFALFVGALVAAILSTVDSTLLVAAGLLSHNLLAPIAGVTRDVARVRMARWSVVGFGVVAYVLARRAGGVFALVEEASAFGSAGVLVTVCFALFTRLGGPRTATATLVGGVVVYVATSAAGVAAPFLASLAASVALYSAGAAVSRLRTRPAPAPVR